MNMTVRNNIQKSKQINYDNTASGLNATNVKDALDELETKRENLSAGISVEPTYIDNGDGSVTVNTFKARLRRASESLGIDIEIKRAGNIIQYWRKGEKQR